MKRRWVGNMLLHWLGGILSLTLASCSTADSKDEPLAGSIQAVNHTTHAINWFEVNGYRASGGGGSACCIVMPATWRPGLKANIEWEVDPEPFEKIKRKSTGFGFDDEAWDKHEAKFKKFSEVVDIPRWEGTERCGLTVHFLVCNKIKVTTSCWGYGSPNNPIKEPRNMKEPAVCPK